MCALEASSASSLPFIEVNTSIDIEESTMSSRTTMPFILGLSSLLCSRMVSGFATTGYLGQRCSGAEEFSRTLGVQDGCVTTGAGQAESIIVSTQATDQDGDCEP